MNASAMRGKRNVPEGKLKKNWVSRACLLLAKRLLLGLALALVIATVGCKHTAHGVGQDLEQAGEKIQEKTR